MTSTPMKDLGRCVMLTCSALFLGCDSTPREPVISPSKDDPSAMRSRSPQDPKSTLPRPDPVLINFDPETRTLTLYELPDREARWMMTTSLRKNEPVNVIHWFSDDVDLDKTSLFYTTVAGRASPRITLKDVLQARVQARIE